MVTKAELDAEKAKVTAITASRDELAKLLVEYDRKLKDIEERLRLVEAENLSLKNLNGNDALNEKRPQTFSSMLKKNSPSANSILASVAKENQEKQKIANNITISGLKESTDGDQKDKVECDKILIKELLEEVDIDYSSVKRFRRVTSKQANTDRPSLLIVELNDKELKDAALNNSRKLRDSEKFKSVFINKELTQAESTEEKRLRTERNSLNENLSEGEGRLKYGKDGDKEFYYGIRFGEVRKIDRSTNRIFRKY